MAEAKEVDVWGAACGGGEPAKDKVARAFNAAEADCRVWGEGLLVASLASLSRRLLCPVEDSRRCFVALWTLFVRLCPPVVAKLPGPWWLPLVRGRDVFVAELCGMDIGAAFSAAMDKESRLATGFSLWTELMFLAIQIDGVGAGVTRGCA